MEKIVSMVTSIVGKFNSTEFWAFIGGLFVIVGGIVTTCTTILLIAEAIAKLTKTEKDDVVVAKWKKRLQKWLGYVTKYSSKLTTLNEKIDRQKLENFDKAVADAVAKLKTEETVELDESGKGTEPEKEEDSTEESQEG